MIQRIFDHFLKRSTLAVPDRFLTDFFGGNPTNSGRSVSADTALSYSTVYACVSLIAETIASLPLKMFKRDGDNRRTASEHYLYELLRYTPNDEMSSFHWREAFVSQLLLWGNAYNYVERLPRTDDISAIYPLTSAEFSVDRTSSGKIVYLRNGREARNVFAIPALGFDGVAGRSPISVAREAIGLGLAAEEFGARYFGSGTNPSMHIFHPQKLSDTAREQLQKSIAKANSGLGNSHKAMLFENGMTVKNATIPPEDSQFLETRSFQRSEICAIYRVPPFMVGDVEKQTSWGTGVEQQQIGFVTHTIRPWLVRIEQVFNMHLLSKKERKQGYFIEFVVDGLLRGDLKSRYEAYAIGRTNGWLNSNEIRRLENMNPRDGGDIYLDQVNMAPTEKLGEDKAVEGKSVRDIEHRSDPRIELQDSFKELFKATTERALRREIKSITRAIEKNAVLGNNAFLESVEKIYESLQPDMERDFFPIFRTYAEAVQAAALREIGEKPNMTAELEEFVRACCEAFAYRYVSSSSGQLRQIAEETDNAELRVAVETRLSEWEARRADKVANREVVQQNNAVARFVWIAAGITRFVWRTRGSNTCPYCKSLSGKVVGRDVPFVGEGDFTPDGFEDSPFKVRGPKFQPPLHQGCVCTIEAKK